MHLLDLLFPPRESERLMREGGELFPYVEPQVVQSQTISIVSLLPYQTPLVRAYVVEAKYHRNQKAQRALGKVLADYLLEYLGEEAAAASGPLILLPIPLSKDRERKRGYNQVVRIAQAALEGLPNASLDSDTLYRTRDTLPQTTLARKERIQNMTGAFAAKVVDPGATYIILDDVATTGATLAAATAALIEAGATRVVAIALAH